MNSNFCVNLFTFNPRLDQHTHTRQQKQQTIHTECENQDLDIIEGMARSVTYTRLNLKKKSVASELSERERPYKYQIGNLCEETRN